jgi:hypothetical protein
MLYVESGRVLHTSQRNESEFHSNSFARLTQGTAMRKTPSKNMLRVLDRAAELRATGHTWEQIARKIRRPFSTLADWRRSYPAMWEEAIAKARREVSAQASAEGVSVLRNLLTSEDEKVRRDASAELLTLRPKEEPAPEVSSDLVQFVQLLLEMPHVDLESLLAESVRAIAIGREHPAPVRSDASSQVQPEPVHQPEFHGPAGEADPAVGGPPGIAGVSEPQPCGAD